MQQATMRAARFHGARDVRIDTIPIPTPKENEVLIAVEWCGICGSDLHEYTDGPLIVPVPGRPHALTHETTPLTFGHEFCGRITHAPANTGLQVGQAVMVDPRLYCGACPNCASLATHACHSWGFHGLSGGGGGLSEVVAVDAKMCYILPESAPLELAALIEPLTVAHHGVKSSGIADFADKAVLVLGGGPIGLAVVMMLRSKSVKWIAVSEPTEKRKGQCSEFVDLVLNPLKEKVGNKCREENAGKGVDVVFDCAGIQPGMNDGMNALRWGGVYLNIAGWQKPMSVPQGSFMMKEITIKASMSYDDEDFRETVDLFIQGKFKGVEKFVTSRISLENVVGKGFEELLSNKDDHIKILVSPKRELIL